MKKDRLSWSILIVGVIAIVAVGYMAWAKEIVRRQALLPHAEALLELRQLRDSAADAEADALLVHRLEVMSEGLRGKKTRFPFPPREAVAMADKIDAYLASAANRNADPAEIENRLMKNAASAKPPSENVLHKTPTQQFKTARSAEVEQEAPVSESELLALGFMKESRRPHWLDPVFVMRGASLDHVAGKLHFRVDQIRATIQASGPEDAHHAFTPGGICWIELVPETQDIQDGRSIVNVVLQPHAENKTAGQGGEDL
ncbi:MAG: hypothetical protein RRC34_04230 [Lentisphaeria bacterium]|nr:hypothetical protein [Lentisphaeria bacterium]